MPSRDEDYDYFCDSCDQGLYDGEAHHADDHTYCDGCYESEDRSPIRNYGHKPHPNFMLDDGSRSLYQVAHPSGQNGRLILAMGIEQEVEFVNHRLSGSLEDNASKVLDDINTNGEIVYLKEDGSISYGFEIVSHPGTLGFFMNHFNWNGIESLSKRGFESWNQRSCGLHIHMSRRAFKDDKHLFKFLVFIYKNPNQLIQFAGRNSSYAKFDVDTFLNGLDSWGERLSVRGSSFMKMAKNETINNERYCAVNLRNIETVELRFFRPSLRANTVKAALQFCDAAFNYTESVNTKEVMSEKALSFEKFHQWVKEQKDKYQILDNRIAERVKVIKPVIATDLEEITF